MAEETLNGAGIQAETGAAIEGPPASPAPVTPEAEPVIPEGPAWRRILPPEMREYNYVLSNDSFQGFLKQADHAIRAQGRSIILPESPEDPLYEEKVKQVYRRLGAPESVEGYKGDIPEGMPVNQGALEAFRDSSFQLGLTQKQYEGILQAQLESARKQAESLNLQRAQLVQEMKNEWGGEVHRQRDVLAREVMRRWGVLDMIDAVGLFAIKEFVTAAANAGMLYQREGLIPDGVTGGRSVQELTTEILELKGSEAYRSSGHMQHAETQARVKRLEDERFVRSQMS